MEQPGSVNATSSPLKRVFVSYESRDAGVAKRLKERLLHVVGEDRLFFFWAGDGDSNPPGTDWFKNMSDALKESDAMLVLVSEHSEHAPWVLYEAGFAAGIGKEIPVISILVPGYPPERLSLPLSRLQHMEIQGPDSLERIVKALLGRDVEVSFTPEDVSYIFGDDVVDLRERPKVESVFLSSRHEIYNEIVRLIRESGKNDRIRATATLYDGDSSESKVDPFDRYIKALVGKIAAAAQSNGGADYTLVLSFELDEDRMPAEDRQVSIRNRLEVFEDKGILSRIKLYWRPDHWDLDIFILGDNHLVLGFPQDAHSSMLQCAVRITGKDFVADVRHWFEHFVKQKALRIDPVTLRVDPEKSP